MLHEAWVDKLKTDGHIRTARVESAFRAVPRHLFLPGVDLERVYSDEAVTTKRIDGIGVSSASQPSVVAVMLEQLRLEPGLGMLEIGAGTGYNAALMAHIVGDGGHVVTIDIDDDIVQTARQNLSAAGFETVQVICGDGGLGYAGVAPYDRIVLTVGAWDIAPAWTEQLKPGGILLVPLQLRGDVQKTVAFEQANGHLESVEISDCAFMPLRGAFGGPDRYVRVGSEPSIYLSADDSGLLDEEAISKSMSTPGGELPTGVQTTASETWKGLSLWLALREPEFCNLRVEGEQSKLPCFFRWGTLCATIGLVGQGRLCVLTQPTGRSSSSVWAWDEEPFELWIRSFGSDDSLARRLAEQIVAWDAAGRPSSETLSISAYPMGMDYIRTDNEFVIDKRWTRIVLDWP